MSFSDWKQYFAEPTRRARHLQQMAALNKELNCCIDIFDSHSEKTLTAPNANANDPLNGVPFAIKDNIALAGHNLSCASNMLKGFTTPYSATVVNRLLERNAIPIAKTNLDEFGMGSSTEHSHIGATRNPWNTAFTAGGSSGGSAAAVAAGMVPFALGSDTGGSIRQPAAFCGVYGLKPTYGALSRFGLVAYASSLEVIGIVARRVDELQLVFEALRGADGKDQTTHDAAATTGRTAAATTGRAAAATAGRTAAQKPTTAAVIGYLTDFSQIEPAIQQHYTEMVKVLAQMGYRCQKVHIPQQQLITPAYYTIASAEASANLSRYDAVKYGLRHGFHQNPSEMTRATRSAGFGSEVKLRILLGSYVLRSGFQQQYYGKAQQIRRHLTNQMHSLFENIDLLLLPTFPSLPFRLGGGLSPFQQKQADLFTCLANLTRQPALSLPVAMHDSLPVGMQFIAAHDHEQMLFEVAARYADHFTAPKPPHYLRLEQNADKRNGQTT